MNQLSSCYFCGDALDASLAEYPVVPETLRSSPEGQPTVVLCRGCKRKLDAVMESVVTSVPDETGETREGDDSLDGERDGGDIESTLGDDEDVLRPVGNDVARSDGESASTDRTDGRSDGSDSSPDASEMQWGGPGNPDTDGESAEDSGTGADRSGDAGGQRGDGDSGSDQPTYSSGRRAGYTGEVETDYEDTSGGTDATDGDGDESAGNDRDVSLTRLENTKVMRLLQNREFPVDRDEFVVVASNAYEVTPGDCEKVLDLAIEHDLLREEGEEGHLHPGRRWR